LMRARNTGYDIIKNVKYSSDMYMGDREKKFGCSPTNKNLAYVESKKYKQKRLSGQKGKFFTALLTVGCE
jgi:hypothetical protein